MPLPPSPPLSAAAVPTAPSATLTGEGRGCGLTTRKFEWGGAWPPEGINAGTRPPSSVAVRLRGTVFALSPVELVRAGRAKGALRHNTTSAFDARRVTAVVLGGRAGAADTTAPAMVFASAGLEARARTNAPEHAAIDAAAAGGLTVWLPQFAVAALRAADAEANDPLAVGDEVKQNPVRPRDH